MKFRYCEQVEISDGFYKGQTGTILAVEEHGFLKTKYTYKIYLIDKSPVNTTAHSYLMMLPSKGFEIKIREEYIKSIDKKVLDQQFGEKMDSIIGTTTNQNGFSGLTQTLSNQNYLGTVQSNGPWGATQLAIPGSLQYQTIISDPSAGLSSSGTNNKS